MRQLKRLWRDSTIIAKLGILLLIGFVIMIAGDYAGLRIFSWAGVSNYTKPSDLYEPGKTLWDWLDLLIIPVVLGLGAWWLERGERQAERELADDRFRETALQAYLDQMTELLLKEGLRGSKEDDEVRAVARARTLTALRQLDGERKATLVQFLDEADLINGDDAVVQLHAADLSGVNLFETDLTRANLSGANLRDSSLRWGYLGEVNLSGANLSGANLSGAGLVKASLNGTNLRGANLCGAWLLAADLRGADLREATVREIRYDNDTTWPTGFTPPPDALKIEE